MRTARASGWRRMRSTAPAAPTITPACGPPRSLSPEKHTTVAPASIELRAVGSSARSGRSSSWPEPRSSTSGRPCRVARAASSASRRCRGEADHAEVRLVHAHQRGGIRADRRLVVGQRRAVGGADLDQPRPGLGEDVGDAEPVADLDQLPAADDHLAPAGERRKAQEHGRRVVVHRHPRLGTGELGEDASEVGVARAAGAAAEVVLEVGVAARDRAHALERGGGKRSPAQVGVDDHAGGVQHRAQCRGAFEQLGGPRQEVLRRARLAGRAGFGQRGPDGRDGGRTAVPGDAVLCQAEQGVDRGQLAERVDRHGCDCTWWE